jgi:hypothetical protein
MPARSPVYLTYNTRFRTFKENANASKEVTAGQSDSQDLSPPGPPISFKIDSHSSLVTPHPPPFNFRK